MNGSVKLALAIVFSACLIFSCSLFLLGVEAQVSLEKVSLEDNAIRIQTNSKDPVIDIQLIENTDTCFVNCHAILKITPYQDITLPQQANSEFDWKFEKESPLMDGLLSHHFEILETTEYKVEVPEYGTVLVDSTCYDENNQSYACKVEQTVQSGSHEEIRYRDEYKPFAFWGQTLKENQDYTIKIVGKKKAKLGANNVDWIPTVKGFELKEWDWWNSTWNKCRKITNTSVSDIQYGYQIEFTFGNSDIPYADFMPGAQDIRFTNGTDCNSDGGSPLTFWNFSSNTSDSGTDMVFYVASNKEDMDTFLVYYNTSGVSDASDGEGTFIWFDSFEYADGVTNHGWTQTYGDEDSADDFAFKGNRSLKTTTSYTWAVTENNTITVVEKGAIDSWIYEDMSRVSITLHKMHILNGSDDIFVGMDGNNQTHYIYDYEGSGHLHTNIARTEGWRKFTVSWNGSHYKFYIDDVLAYDPTPYTLNSGPPHNVGFGTWWKYNPADTKWNDLLLYRYWVDAPPTWSIGPKEIEGQCPTDDTYINETTTLEPANMICSIADNGAMGVFIINASNIIFDCNGTTLKGNDVEITVGIYNREFNNVTIKNCKIEDYWAGIKFDYWAYGNLIHKNTLISNGAGAGVFLNESENNTISESSFYSNGNGITIYNGAFGNTIFNSNISDNLYRGLYIDNSVGGVEETVNTTVINSIIESNGLHDIYILGDRYDFIINTTYDTVYISMGNLTRQWYLKVNVTDKNNDPIENAEVTASDNFGNEEWSDSTDANGLTGWNVVTEYVNQSGTVTTYTPQNISVTHDNYASNSTTESVTDNKIVHVMLRNWDITFNVTSGENGNELDNVNINCNYTEFNQNGDTTNPYGPYEFPPGSWWCRFSRTPGYYNKTITFMSDSDKTVNVKMSEKDSLTIEEHNWIEAIYDCLYTGDCLALNLLLNINETTEKTWNQFKRTDQTIVSNEDFISTTVNSTNNITINYTVNIPEKEGYGIIEGIQGYDDFLPIRVHYWFLDENNDSCYSQGNYSVARAEPYCQPLTVYTVGQINTAIDFMVDLRPSLPAGTYNIVRDIEIDPDNVWIDYGQEIIGQIVITEDNEQASSSVKGKGQLIEEDYVQVGKTQTNEPAIVDDRTTGMITTETVDTISYIAVMLSAITLLFMGLMYRNSRKRTPWDS